MECAWTFGPSFNEAFRLVMAAHDDAQQKFDSVARCFAADAAESLIVDEFWREMFLGAREKESSAYAVFVDWSAMSKQRFGL